MRLLDATLGGLVGAVVTAALLVAGSAGALDVRGVGYPLRGADPFLIHGSINASIYSTSRPGGTAQDLFLQATNSTLNGGLWLNTNGGAPIYVAGRDFKSLDESTGATRFSVLGALPTANLSNVTLTVDNGADVERTIQIGAANSCGAGFRCLQVAN